MTDTERSLLDSVLAVPDDDGPRLVYADWLDEHGEPERANFIRFQIREPRRPLRVKWPEGKSPPQWFGFQYVDDVRFTVRPPVECRFSFDAPFQFESAEVRRGFVDSISLSLRQFMGGECERCNKGRRDGEPTGRRWDFDKGTRGQWVKCDKCKGSGRVPGLVERIGGMWPLVSVTLTDREPTNTSPDDWGWHWSWDTNGIGDRTYFIPRVLMNQLSRHGVSLPFHTRAAAMTALSDACVLLLREKAGLRSLKWPNENTPPEHPSTPTARRRTVPNPSELDHLDSV